MDELDVGLEMVETLDPINAKKAQKKKQAAKYVPSWDEIWFTGYGSKKGIFHMSLTDTDKDRLRQVKSALEDGDISRLPEKVGKPISKSEALDLFPSLLEIRKTKILADMLAHKPENYWLITGLDDFVRFIDMLHAESIVALDTETNGLDCHGESVIVGISVTLPVADLHVYIPVGHAEGKQLDRDFVFDALKEWFENWRYRKVLHNSKFDAHMLFRHGIRLRGIHWDTMIAQKILNENEESVALKNLANKYGKLFGYEADSYTYEDLFGKNTPFDVVDIDVGAVYASKDTHLTWLLYKWQQEHFDRLPRLDYVYRQIENPLIDVCITMEQTGFLIDMEFSEQFGELLTGEIQSLSSLLYQQFGVGEEFNFDSPTQLADLLYNRLGLPDKSKGKRSTESKFLKIIKSAHEGIQTYLDYKERTKLYSTYVESLPAKVKRDGRIRGSFNQVATVTGRFSSNDPNLQNLPKEGKKLIIAPDGFVLLGSDFSQIEPRVLAHISGDPDLQAVYRSGVDLYSTLASKVFKVPFEDCLDGSVYRKRMKTILLGVMYGLSSFSLADTLKVSTDEADSFIDDFYTSYPKVYEWIQTVYEFVKKNEYVETLYGRKRRFAGHRERAIIYDRCVRDITDILGFVPDRVWDYPELPYRLKADYSEIKWQVLRDRRQAVNAIIQGSAADIMKLALIKIHEYTQEKSWAICGTVHDEALSLVPESITLQEVEELESIMTNVVELAVPLKVDTEIFRRWGEGISKKAWFKEVA